MKYFAVILFLFMQSLWAQDLTGKWVVVTTMGIGYYGELNLVQNQNNIYAGHSYDTESGGFCRHWLEAKFNNGTQVFSGKDVELIEKSPSHEATDYKLRYEKRDRKEYLIGTQQVFSLQIENTFQSPNSFLNPFNRYYNQLNGSGDALPYQGSPKQVTYVKVSDEYKIFNPGDVNVMTPEEIELKKAEYPEVYIEPEIPNEPELDLSIPETPSNPEILPVPETPKPIEKQSKSAEELDVEIITETKNNRLNEVVSRHNVLDVKEVTLLVRDYGTEDNDSLSIYYNDKLIAKRIGLKSKANEYTLKIDPNRVNELVFVANNQGEIPPNTARITLIMGDKRYHQKLFTDDKKNAVIELNAVLNEED